jgi:hypothetical protein
MWDVRLGCVIMPLAPTLKDADDKGVPCQKKVCLSSAPIE